MKKLLLIETAILLIIASGTSLAQNGWERMASMDIARGGLQSGVIDSMIYVLGGSISGSVYLDSVDAYNTQTNNWSDLEPMMKKLTEFNVEVVNNKIYSIGGWQMNYTTSKSSMEYDPNENTWIYKKDCPKSTGSNTSCVLGDTLYILGGLEYPSSPDQKKTMYYVPETDNWGTGPDMIYDHGSYTSASVYDNKIFVFGGIQILSNGNMTIHGKTEMYDPLKKTWKELAEMPVPVLNHVSIVHHDKFYIFGGDSGTYSHERSYPTNTIQEYDPATDTWKLMQSMPFKRANMTGQKVGNFVYLIGGFQDDSRDYANPLAEVWRFNLDSLKVKDTNPGIANTKASQTVLVYPNPANDIVYIKVPSQIQDEFEVKMFTITGKMILQKIGYIEQIDISGIPTGIYLISVKSKNFVSTKKLIKQ